MVCSVTNENVGFMKHVQTLQQLLTTDVVSQITSGQVAYVT